MSDLLGRVFRRRALQGDEWDVVRIVGFIRAEEVTEAVVQPVAHGKAEKVDGEAFAAVYTSAGVEQIERETNPRGSWGDEIAGTAARKKRGDPVAPTGYDALIHDDAPTDAERRIAALGDSE